MKPSLKNLKKIALAAAVTAVSLSATAKAENLDIGVLLPSPIADVGWSHALVEGFNTVKEKYGDKVNLNIVETI